jgi:arylsulfatase A-like enzyme
MFVHTYAAHRPYAYEDVFGGRGLRPAGLEAFEPRRDTINGARLTPLDPTEPLYGWTANAEQRDYFLTVYDGGVHQVDRLLGELVDALKERDLYEQTLIIVLSDHGEEFWEHIPEGSPEHNHSLFDELLRVPLIIKLPNASHAGSRIDALVGLTDVLPTVLDAVGIEPEDRAPVGVSLLNVMDDPEKRAPERELYVGYTFLGPMRYGLRTERYKYIHAPATRSFTPHFLVPEQALYDLESDPLELRNLALANPEVTEEMHARLTAYREKDIPYRLDLSESGMGKRNREGLGDLGMQRFVEKILLAERSTEPMTEADAETLERLRSLGYVD